jgi:hypothetical protein
MGVTSLGIDTRRIKETINSHPLRSARRRLHRPPFGYLVQLLLEMCQCSQALLRYPPWRRRLQVVRDCQWRRRRNIVD